MLTWRRW